jgi:lysophospholipase L1-like esterase
VPNVKSGRGAAIPKARTGGPRRALLALLAFAAGGLVAILISELALNAVDFPPAYNDHQRLFVEYDSVRGWRNIAGGHGKFVAPEFSVDLEYNSHSYRGPLHPYAKPRGVFRVVLLGDSYLEGYTVALRDRVAEVAQRMLEDTPGAKPAQIIALGTGGYSTDQELLWLESEGVRYDPDLVIVLFVTNDIWFNNQTQYPRGPKPVFRLAGDSLVLSNVPVPRPIPVAPTSAEPASLGLFRHTKRFLHRHSRLAQLTERAVRRTAWLQSFGARIGLLGAPAATVQEAGRNVTVPEELSVFADSLSARADTALEVSARLLARIRASCASVAFLVPPNEAVYPPGVPRARLYQRTPMVGDADRGRVRFRTLCARAGLRCLDPTERFVQAADSLAKDSQLLVFPDDGHWNEKGHRVASSILAEVIRKEMTDPGASGCRAMKRPMD